MNNYVSFNSQILPAEKTFISSLSSAALYGRGVFTTIAIYHEKPFLWDKHWHRLQENSAKLGVDLSRFDEESVKAALLQTASQNQLETGRARLTFFDEGAGKIWNSSAESKTSLLITTAQFREVKETFRLTVSPFAVNSKSPLAGVKSCNYLEPLLALEDARKNGFDEAVRFNERDEIVSTAMANIFWTRGEKIFTPPLETGCLAGTTRAFVLENFAVEETCAAIDELRQADEIFLTSSGVGIRAAYFEGVGKKISQTLVKLNQLLDLEKLRK